MDNSNCVDSSQKDSSEVPTLIRHILTNEVPGFDNTEHGTVLHNETESSTEQSDQASQFVSHPTLPHSVSISMPSSPKNVHLKSILFNNDSTPNKNSDRKVENPTKFHSETFPIGSTFEEAIKRGNFAYQNNIKSLKDNRFDTFKTWSGQLERHITKLRGKQPQETGEDEIVIQHGDIENPPHVDRYFDALEGPELDTLKASEEILLPDDKKWPFLLRYPISSFGICLGVSSQAIMWKTLATSTSTKFLHLSLKINLILWIISVILVACISSIYLMKLLFYFEAVRREFFHPIRVNFFFAPWIALFFLAIGAPPSIATKLPPFLWYILMTPIFCLELKIYGHWMSGGERRLSKVANPSNHLAIIGNFVGALLGASMGLREGPIFFFAVGLAHYTVLFVTLYQKLPTNETLPKELHPVFFLFVAAPSVASMAWAKIQGSFDYGARIPYFIALFLYFSLAVRVNFFRGFKFSLAWWAYTFPMTGAAIATVRYSSEVTNVVTQSLTVLLSAISTFTVTALLVRTAIHAFVLRDLFPNDIAIAISDRKPNLHKKWFHIIKHGSSDSSKDIENFLKFSPLAGSKDLEVSVKSQNSDESS